MKSMAFEPGLKNTDHAANSASDSDANKRHIITNKFAVGLVLVFSSFPYAGLLLFIIFFM